MKYLLATVLMATMFVAGCNTSGINKALQAGAPQACMTASDAYTTYLATGPSAKELGNVNRFYTPIRALCLNPANVTVEQAAIVAAQSFAMFKAMKGK